MELTKDEAKQLEEAFNDKSFRQLLSDYASELSDPKYREETEGNSVTAMRIKQ
jgi:hypothetical protein